MGLWCKFAHVSAKGISISLFLWPEEDLSAKSKAARCWAVSSCKDEVTYKKTPDTNLAKFFVFCR